MRKSDECVKDGSLRDSEPMPPLSNDTFMHASEPPLCESGGMGEMREDKGDNDRDGRGQKNGPQGANTFLRRGHNKCARGCKVMGGHTDIPIGHAGEPEHCGELTVMGCSGRHFSSVHIKNHRDACRGKKDKEKAYEDGLHAPTVAQEPFSFQRGRDLRVQNTPQGVM